MTRALTSHLLDCARILAGVMPLDTLPVALALSIEAARAAARGRARQRHRWISDTVGDVLDAIETAEAQGEKRWPNVEIIVSLVTLVWHLAEKPPARNGETPP